jgi:hypothetical protein
MPASTAFMAMDEASPGILLPMERPLYKIPVKPVITETRFSLGTDPTSPQTCCYASVFVDRLKLKQQYPATALQTRDQVTLAEILARHPLEKGLAELVTYLTLAGRG